MDRDIIIIGGGPGGYVAAIRAAQLGASVTLIERDKIGGTCLNYGCVPTKTLYRNAEVLRTLSQGEEYGISIDNYSFDVDKIQARKTKVVKQLVEGIERLLAANKVEVISGSAEFIDNHTIKITGEDKTTTQLRSKNIIIATGSRALLPPIEGIDLEGVYTSKEMLEFSKVPEKIAIIGGGVIGMEFACIFQAMGAEVIVVEYEKDILPLLDKDLSKRFAASLKKSKGDGSFCFQNSQHTIKPMAINTGTKVIEIKKESDKLILVAENKKGELTLEADAVLVSTGRQAVFQDLNLGAANIKYNRSIEVDKNFMTNVQGVYAIGDVNGKTMLAHAASHQGITAVEHIMKIENHIDHKLIPNCIFVFPEIAAVGLTEKIAKDNNIAYKSSKFQFAANAKALAIGEEEGFVKVITDMDDIVLGVQIMGAHATELIHEGALAIKNKMKLEDITNTIHAHPTLSEAFIEAALNINQQAIHISPGRF
jgi:dihydrolipoamide dehydrogenase